MLTKVWLQKVLEFQQTEHKARKTTVAEKLMSSPERDKELLKERMEQQAKDDEPR